MDLLRKIPVNIRAKVYRGAVAVGGTATAAGVVLMATGYPAYAAITGIVVTGATALTSALAAVNTPTDWQP